MVTNDTTDLPGGFTDDGEIAEQTEGTETSFDLTTGGQLEDEIPAGAHENLDKKEISVIPEKSTDDVLSNAHPGEKDFEREFRSLDREKRQTDKEEEEHSQQDLDHESHPDDIDSSRLPVEHRGMMDDEHDHVESEHDHHSDGSSAPVALLSYLALTMSTLFLFYLNF